MSATTTASSRLRVAQIWRGEIMDEKIFTEPAEVTLGGHKGVTFVTPEVGLPPTFKFLRPTNAGYVLTLGASMGGKLHLGGRPQDVRDFIAEGGGRADGTAGSFRAVPVQPGDWGVIHVDGVGDHAFFFQFVPQEAPLPRSTLTDTELLIPALLFAFVLHAILLSLTWVFQDDDKAHFAFAAGDAVLGIMVNRPPPSPEVPEVPEELLRKEEPKAGLADGDVAAPAASASGDAGKAGGEGDRPRRRVPNPGDPPARRAPNVGLIQHGDRLAMIGRPNARVGSALSRLKGMNDGGDGYGRGSGTGVGDFQGGTGTLTRGGGDGPGGGGTAHADLVTQDKIDTGGTRPPRGVPGGKGVSEVKVQVAAGQPDGDFGDLTAEQILKAVMARKGMFQACFERELQRIPNLSGTITVTWRIDGTGSVTMSKLKSSTMGNANVESCVVRSVRYLKFPPPSGGSQAIVNFPFVFAPRR